MPQETEPEIREERIARLVRLSARAFKRALTLRLSRHGVTFGQWIFLRILWQEEGLPQRELSLRANLTEPTTHTALKSLEAQGLIRRENVDGNKRRQHAFLTEKGHALRHVLEPLAVEVNEIALSGLPHSEHERLRTLLLSVIQNLEADEESQAKLGHTIPATRNFGKT